MRADLRCSMGTLGGSIVSEAAAQGRHDKKADANANLTSDFLKTIVTMVIDATDADEIRNNYAS